MHEDGVFLELMQLTDAGRKVVGRESMEIKDEDVETAKVIDQVEGSHEVAMVGVEHDSVNCAGCQAIHQSRVNLRDKLHSQGQDFPLGMLS